MPAVQGKPYSLVVIFKEIKEKVSVLHQLSHACIFYRFFNTRDMQLLPKLHLNLVCTLACYSQLTFISNKYIVLHNILTTTNKLLKYVRFLKISY